MPDDEGYPTEDELQKLRDWPISEDYRPFFAYVKSIGHWWSDETFGWHEYDGRDDFGKPTRVYLISTGGWSGNEEIIDVMRTAQHGIPWMVTWVEHRRGGHYLFEVKR